MNFKPRMKFFKWKKTNSILWCLSFFLIYPLYLKADESDFKVDEANSFPVVEKKATFNKYEGKFTQKPTGLSEQIFPSQKLFIKLHSEYGGHLFFDGKPITSKDKIFTHILFSPDHQEALAYGITPQNKRIYFINDRGSIFKTIDLEGMFAKSSKQGFIVLSGELTGDKHSISTGHGVFKLYLCKWSFSGEEIWRKEIIDGGVFAFFSTKLSVSPNGNFIILGLDQKGSFPGSTRILDENGNVLEKLNETSDSFFSNDNETAVLVSRQHLRIINVKDKTILFRLDLDGDSKSFFGLAKNNESSFGPDENYRGDKVVVTVSADHLLVEVLVIDLKNKTVTKMDAGSKDRGVFGVYYSESENKVVIKSHNLKDYGLCESIDSKN